MQPILGTQNLVAQKFESEFQEELKKREFPRAKLYAIWLRSARKALQFASPMSLGITPTEMVELVQLMQYYNPSESNTTITLLQFATLSNNLETRNMQELGLNADEYCEMINIAGELSKEWNSICKVIRDEVMTRLMAQQKELDAVADLQSKNGLKALPQA